VLKEHRRYSYLLELQEAERNRKFVYYVNADDANKWISLGEFDVVKPFGVESLQVIASTVDPVDELPSYRYDPKTGLYISFREPKEGVLKARALRKKMSEEAQTAEAVLMLTTMEK
jgi:hypothetical protein